MSSRSPHTRIARPGWVIACASVSAALAVAQGSVDQGPVGQGRALPLDELDDAAWLDDFASEAPNGEEPRSVEVLGGEDVDAAIELLAVLPASHAPETYLARLSDLAAGDDPDLAPAAARAAHLIVDGSSASDLGARESFIDETVTSAFRSLAEDPTARSDIQSTAAYIVARLGELERPDAP